MEERIATGPMAPRNDKIIDVPVHQQRSLATVTAEIRTIRAARDKMFLEASVEIGRRLKEAKELVGHGGWGDYCKTELDFSQQTAQNHIRLFEAYAAEQIRLDGAALKSQSFGNLSYTQALALLALPSEEEREAFVASHDLGSMSTRELREELRKRQQEPEDGEEPSGISGKLEEALEKLRTAEEDRDKAEAGEDKEFQRANALQIERDQMRDQLTASQNERNKAKAAAEAAAERAAQAEKKAQEAADRMSALQTELDKARKAEDKAKRELEQAKENKTASPELLAQLRKEAEAAAEARHKADSEELQAAKAQCVKAETDVDTARQEAARARQEAEAAAKSLAALQKELRMAEPKVAVFRDRFTSLQGDLSALIVSIDELPEDKQAGARKGLRAILQNALNMVQEPEEGTNE